MSQTEIDHPPRARSAVDSAGVDEDLMGAPEEVLSLLSDEHARTIMAAVGDGALPARKLVDCVDASRATVYRRLDRLEEVGLLETRTTYHPDGHHRQEFSLAVDRVELSLGADGVDLRDPT